MENSIKKLQKFIFGSERVVALTGAGISAESGIPTFRGTDGIWKTYQVTEVATPQAFARDPKLVWEFYNWRRNLINKITFNPGHRALADIEKRLQDFTLVTQNVDGLHRAAGSKNVLEIHGSLWDVKCVRCGVLKIDMSSNMGLLPRCEECNGLLRPNVVWFGESLDPVILGKAIEVAQDCQVMLIIGTSGIVQPAASLAYEAKAAGAVVAEINIERTTQSALMDFVLTGKAGEILPMLVEGIS